MPEPITLEGNEAAATVAYRTNEVIAIYPITPSSNMGEFADAWAASGKTNMWGDVPIVVEMQSEGGAAGAVHGSLQAGALTTTFTASQGLLLMIPNMFKIAGELTSTVFHVSARTVATHALSIFGDHSDVMATRTTGWALMPSGSVQEVLDLALIAQASTLRSRVPFLHFFDGFRTSHEVQKVIPHGDEVYRAMIDEDLVRAHRQRALDPERPVIRGTAQNPDVFFQAREACNPFYARVPEIVQAEMDRFAALTGRAYHLFDYVGAPDAERIIVIMGSGAETVDETVAHLVDRGEKVGLVKVRLYRPFDAASFVRAVPESVRAIAVLDRTKEPGALGEPLYKDVVAAWHEKGAARHPVIVGGRYGLSSKEFTPAMVKAVFDNLAADSPRNHFTVGIVDDVSGTSLDYDPSFTTEAPDVTRCVFFGLGSDGTVGANKNSIKIIGEETPNYAQGYFVYDSKKSGSVTVSHLRFGPRPIKSAYLVSRANFVGIHQFGLIFRLPVFDVAEEGATVLINSSLPPERIWDELPRPAQEQILAKKLQVYVLDGYRVARETGMGGRINTIMQTAFFALSGILPREEAIEKIRETIRKTYGRRGEKIVQQNFAAVDRALSYLHRVPIPDRVTSDKGLRPPVPEHAPPFVREVLGEIIAMRGDAIPVSKMPVDGTFPTGTAAWEKRSISLEVPVWDPALCTQCGRCVIVCPHAVIRAKLVPDQALAGAPPGIRSAPAKWRGADGYRYVLGLSTEDCTGCALCYECCPAKDRSAPARRAISLVPVEDGRDERLATWEAFLSLPDERPPGADLKMRTVKDVQLLPALFEFSGACSGCGETPYVKLLSMLFGDRALIANATGCSSIYCGNLPTTPWTTDKNGRGPAWSNSLFEDNAEFGFGMRLALEARKAHARRLVEKLLPRLGEELAERLLSTEAEGLDAALAKREAVQAARARLESMSEPEARELAQCLDALLDRSVWIVGGDGWAYDIGYGGLDHVLAAGLDVNLLVLDTEVYSNTGGQASKATPRGAVAKFAAGGMPRPKKDLGRMAMTYGHVYVAQVALGANDGQCLRAFLEAESYRGPSLIIAYSHCIAHGIDMSKGLEQQKAAVQSGYWPLYRFDPRRAREGKNPLQIDCDPPRMPVADYLASETRYRMLQQADPQAAERLWQQAQRDVDERWAALQLAASGKENTV